MENVQFIDVKPFADIKLTSLNHNKTKNTKDELASILNIKKKDLKEMHITEKSCVFSFKINGTKFVVKKNFLTENYERELFTYYLFADTKISPKLHFYDNDNQILILEYLKPLKKIDSYLGLKKIAKCLVKVQKLVHQKQSVLSENFPTFTLSNYKDIYENNSLIKDFSAFEKYIDIQEKVWGKDYIGFSIGDIKEKHFLLKKNQVRMVDFETSNFNMMGDGDFIWLLKSIEQSPQYPALKEKLSKEYYGKLSKALNVDLLTHRTEILDLLSVSLNLSI